MTIVCWITTSFLIVHMSQAYILLTANMEDVQSIAKQLASAPVVEKVQDIWQRASHLFQQQLNDPDSRRSGVENEIKKGNEPTPAAAEKPTPDGSPADDVVKDLIALGKNASVYIKSIKSALESTL